MATITHEGSHFNLAANRVVNFLGATVCSGYAILQSFCAYLKSHLAHHLFLGSADRDPDFKFQKEDGTYDETSRLRFALKYLLAPLFLVKTPRKIVDLVRYRLLARPTNGREWWDQIGSLGFFSTGISLFVWSGYGWEFLLFWIVPLLTTFPIVNYYNELLEHFPYAGESNVDILMSRNRWTDPVTRFFTGMFNEHMHQTHHLFPHCPFWALPKIHLILMEDPVYAATQHRDVGLFLPVIGGIPTILSNILASVAKRSKRASSE